MNWTAFGRIRARVGAIALVVAAGVAAQHLDAFRVEQIEIGRKDQASAHTLTSGDRWYAHLLSFSHPRPPPDRMPEIPAEPRLQEPSDRVSRNACSHRSLPRPGHPRS